MAKGKEEVYNSLFDYIFSTKKARGGNPIEGVNISALSGVGKGLAEIAAYPAIYPVQKIVEDFNFQVDLATNAKTEPGGVKLQVGAGSIMGVLANPKRFIDKAWADYMEGQKSAALSGRLRYIDGAQFALMARKYGLSWNDAISIGASVADATGISKDDIEKGANRGMAADYSSRVDQVTSKGTGLGVAKTYEGTIGAMSRGVNAEFDAAIRKFELLNGIKLSDTDRNSVRKDFLIYFKNTSSYRSKDQRRQNLRQALDGYSVNVNGVSISLNDDIKSRLVSGLWGEEETGQPGSPDEKYQKDDLGYYDLASGDVASRMKFAASRSQLENLNSVIESTTDPALKRKLIGFRDVYYKYISGQKVSGAYSLGSNFGQLIYLNRWVKGEMKGKFIASLVTGSLFDFQNDVFKSGYADKFISDYVEFGLTKNKLKYLVGSKDSSGKLTAMGRLTEAYYYLHPVNILKGLFWDGRTWKKLADLKLLGMNPDIAKKIIALLPNSLLVNIIKPSIFTAIVPKMSEFVSYPFRAGFALFAKTFVKDFANIGLKDIMKIQFRELVQKVATKLLTQILGSTVPIVGNLVALIADFAVNLAWKFSQKVLKPLMEFLLLIVLGLISLLFLLPMLGLGGGGKQILTQPYLSSPTSTTSGHLVYGPIDFDFPSVSDGEINCNQTLPDQNIPGILGKEAFGKLADRWTARGGKNYADECYNDVICRAGAAGIDPAFALAVWLHESGASNYEISPGNIEDFGIHFTTPEDFNKQISAFTNLNFKCQCPSISDYATCWASDYLTGGCNEQKGAEYLKSFMVAYGAVTNNPFPTAIKDPSRATGQMCQGIGGSHYIPYGGSSYPYGGQVLSGTAKQIWDQVVAEFGMNSSLILVYPGSTMYDSTIGPGAWCFSSSGTIYCKADKIGGASASLLTGLFRHEVTHHVQQSNGSLSNWPSKIREWGAEHLSGNGGNYSFYTSSGQCMRGLQVSQSLIDSGNCTASDLDQIARGLKPGGSCSSQVSTFITGAKIGRCN